MCLEIWSDHQKHLIKAEAALEQGVETTWKVGIDINNKMFIRKNGALVAEAAGAVPASMKRSKMLVGRSSWATNNYLNGAVLGIDVHTANSVNNQDFLNKPVKITGAFEAKVHVRFDKLPRFVAKNQRIFDLGNGENQDNIFLGRHGDSKSLEFGIVVNGVKKSVIASNVLEQNEFGFFTVRCDATGKMSIIMDSNVVAEGAGHVPANVDRANMLVGKSNWKDDAIFEGAILGLTFTNL